jgi:hypothetical protein
MTAFGLPRLSVDRYITRVAVAGIVTVSVARLLACEAMTDPGGLLGSGLGGV